MSLRYRLFLAVSGLFIVIAVCSFFMENYVTRRGLAKAQASLREKILSLSEERRVDLQNFLASAIADNEEEINALLTTLSSFTPQMLRFGPTTANSRNGTWGEAADLLLDNRWIDFLQNTNQGKVTAAIVPKQKLLDPSYRIDIDADLSWIYVSDFKAHPDPYLGVRLPYSPVTKESNLQEVPEKVPGIIPDAFLLFDINDMYSAQRGAQPIFQKNENPSPIPVNWTEGYELEVAPIVKAFQRAVELLQAKKIQPPQLTESELAEKMDGRAAAHSEELAPIPLETLFSVGATENVIREHLEEIALNYTQTTLIWSLTALHESGVFGDNIFSFPSPSAITLFSSNNNVGVGLIVREVLFPEPLFGDSGYFENSPPKNAISNLGSSMAVIALPHSEHVYLGNTAQLGVKTPSEERTGYLTLGIDIDILLQRLVMAIHQSVMIVHDGKALSAYGKNGKRLKTDQFALPFAQMLNEKSGIVPWDKENYFFMHIQPFPDVDLHFFLFNLEADEFALLRDLESGSKQVVDSILLNIHVAGFIALIIAVLMLYNISRRITKPIIQLANATREVAEGHLDQIQLSLPPLKHNDEIAMLCHSFEEMVQGLIEKEKVKGVLNKVVSSEIAQEILKGTVHLGGEEKKVTVLFADIRDFTKMTQNMLPKQVIELLNGCMTKISEVIDKNGGVIDKYVGDEAMALFGAPIAHEDSTFKAILSAVEMVAALKNWNRERNSKGMPEIEMGIGIHTGQMLAGNMGAENRLNYTVIGSNVNLASRLCAAAKRMEILITKDTLDEPFVKDKVIYEAMPPMSFKGIDKPIEIFRVQRIK